MTPGNEAGSENTSENSVGLSLLVERHLIRPHGSRRHIVFSIGVSRPTSARAVERPPLRLALVLDRSGSMAGGKLETAKRAAVAVLDRLDERDQASVVIYDDRVDVLQPLAPVTESLRSRMRQALRSVQPRASTALHEGWLTGCQTLAGDGLGRLARCFLLTDGLANVGITDAEQIAGQAAGVRENAGISTSTFGIGEDYNEGLLGPMAVAGSGQFHHLRQERDILDTFVGELGELLSVAASRVQLDIEMAPGMTMDVVSAYWASAPSPFVTRHQISVGDLLAGEERRMVVRFGFPPSNGVAKQTVLARLVWVADGRERATEWSEAVFIYAGNEECDREASDREALHWVGLHHAERARRQASQLSRQGDLSGARQAVHGMLRRLESYAAGDAELEDAVRELHGFEQEVAAAPMASDRAKELLYQSQRRSRGQRDHREQE